MPNGQPATLSSIRCLNAAAPWDKPVVHSVEPVSGPGSGCKREIANPASGIIIPTVAEPDSRVSDKAKERRKKLDFARSDGRGRGSSVQHTF